MINEEKDLKDWEIEEFIHCSFISKRFSRYGQKPNLDALSSADWEEWRKSKLEDMLREEEHNWILENWNEFLEWEVIPLGKKWDIEKLEGIPYTNELERIMDIGKQIENLQYEGYKIYPESLTANKYDDGYLILVSRSQEDEKRAEEKRSALNENLRNKRAEFEKKISIFEEQLKDEEQVKELDKQINENLKKVMAGRYRL